MSAMIIVTPAAIQKLSALLMEHPEDPVVRIVVTDLDDHRLAFGLTLEEEAQPGDEIQVIEGLTVAIEKRSAPRMDGMTMDYREPEGFRFLHPATTEELTRPPSNFN